MTPDIGRLVLRLAGLSLALGHGWGKVAGLVSGQSGFPRGLAEMGFPVPILFAWAAALAEFAGGLAVALGLFTRCNPELALAYLTILVGVALLGPGGYSIDARLGRG